MKGRTARRQRQATGHRATSRQRPDGHAPQFTEENDGANAYAANGNARSKSERDAYAAIYRKASRLYSHSEWRTFIYIATTCSPFAPQNRRAGRRRIF